MDLHGLIQGSPLSSGSNAAGLGKQMLVGDLLDTVARAGQNTGQGGEVSLAGISEGAVFKGRILDIRGDGVTIDVGEGFINARFQGDLSLSIGQDLQFTVRENSDGKVVIAPFYPDGVLTGENVALYKALEGAGMPATDINIDTVLTMLSEQMPVDKDSVHAMLAQVHRFPETSPETIVMMHKLQIPLTEQNIQSFTDWQKGQFTFTQEMASFAKQVADGIEQTGMLDSVQKDQVIKEFAKIFPKADFNGGIEKALLQELSIRPEEFTKENVIQHFEKTAESMERVHNVLEKVSQALAEQVETTAGNVNQSMDFMKALNHQIASFQIPVHMKDSVVGNDLYVYGDGKQLDVDAGVRLYLNLDMPSLGMVGTLVEMKERDVTLTFRVEDAFTAELLSKNLSLLTDRLEEKGVLARGTVTKNPIETEKDGDASPSVVMQVIKENDVSKGKHRAPTKRFSFDMRV